MKAAGWVIAGSLVSGAAFGQNAALSPAAAIQSKQQPGTSMRPAPDITNKNAYPFGEGIDILEGKPRGQAAATNQRPTVPSIVAAKRAAAAGGPAMATGSAIHPRRLRASVTRAGQTVATLPPVQLPPPAKAALAVGDTAKTESPLPAPGKDGRVLFTYGLGLPTVICAPERICTVELEPGERITGQPGLGDSVRWEMLPGITGTGDRATPVVMLKPRRAGLDTDLVITTDKRTYYLRLISDETDYIARTAFTYKDEEDARWKSFMAEQDKRKADDEAKQVVTPVANDAIDKLNFDYEVKGGNNSIRPVRVFDDGVKTYITMPEAVLSRELPALIVQNNRVKGQKGEEIVNYRVQGRMYIADRLFDRAALVIGSGKTAEKVEIRREKPVSGGM